MGMSLLSKRELEPVATTDRGGRTGEQTYLNRMWRAGKLQESWMFSTNSLSFETLSDGPTCNTERGRTPRYLTEDIHHYPQLFIASFTCEKYLNCEDEKSLRNTGSGVQFLL